jgi:acyl carrier protein
VGSARVGRLLSVRTAASPAAAERFELLRSALAHACGVEAASIVPQSDMLELGLDSLSLVYVLTLMETACGCDLTSEDMLGMLEASSVEELADALERAVARAAAAAC